MSNYLVEISGGIKVYPIRYMPFSVEFVCGCRVDILQLFLKIRSKMDGAVQVFPNQGIMLDILYEVFLGHLSSGQIFDSVD